MNRQQLRSVQHLPAAQFYQVISNVVNEEAERARSYAYYDAWASMFTVLVDYWPEKMTGDMLHSIAVDTLKYINGTDTPAELAQKLLDRTGFDIYEAPSKSALNYLDDKGGL